MKDLIVAHLIETYSPDAIILHGSRARGKERSHSDWDFILLYTNPTNIKSGRILYENQNIEFSVHTFPVLDIFDTFNAKLQGAKVLYEKDTTGTALLNQAYDYYAEGVHWSPEKVADHKLWMEGRINGMRDNVDNPMVFEKYYTDLYSRIFNYWYWLLRNRHSQPVYIANEEIAKVAPIYHQLVMDLIDPESSLSQKVATAEKIQSLLFTTE